MKKDSIGNRMKENYEFRSRIKLTRRIPVIIRLDGNAFHTLTRNCEKPFDEKFSFAMCNTAVDLCNEIQGCKCSYVQSDEISLLLTDFDKLNTDAWFDYNKSKIESISASKASLYFTNYYWKSSSGKFCCFDSRSFNIPKEEVRNYFIWRQKDWIRNSVSMLAQSLYSHKQLHGKNQKDMHEMIHEAGYNWAKLGSKWKNGIFIYRDNNNIITEEDMIFTEEKGSIIQKFLEPLED